MIFHQISVLYWESVIWLLKNKGLTAYDENDIIKKRYNDNHDSKGRFAPKGGSGSAGKTKYAPSPRRNPNGITVSPKKYVILCGELKTRYPNAKKGKEYIIRDSRRQYHVKPDGFGGMEIIRVYPIKEKKR